MTLDPMTLLTILGMALVTYATRIAGPLFLHGRQFGPRVTLALDALPPAVLIAVIAPSVIAAGPAEAIAGAITALAALRLPFLAVIALGTASVVALRYLIG